MALLDNKEIGKRLKNHRLRTEMSSRKFAKKAGIDPSQYAKIEKGDLPITDNLMEKLIETFGMDKNYVMFGIPVPHENEGNELNDDEVDYKLKLKSTKKEISQDLTMQVLSDLAESHKNMTAAHKELAESNNTLAKNQETILARIPTTAGEKQENPLETSEMFSRIIAMMAKIGTGKQWSDEQEAIKELNSVVPLPRWDKQ